MINQGVLALAFVDRGGTYIENIISNNDVIPKGYLLNCVLSRSLFSSFGEAYITTLFPNIQFNRYEHIQVLYYNTKAEAENNKNKIILMDGVKQEHQDYLGFSNTTQLTVQDKASLLQQSMNPIINYDIVNFKEHIIQVLNDNFSNSISANNPNLWHIKKIKNNNVLNKNENSVQIVFPSRNNLNRLSDSEMTFGSGNKFRNLDFFNANRNPFKGMSIYHYIEQLVNQMQLLLTTQIYNNQEYLFFFDTANYIREYIYKDKQIIEPEMLCGDLQIKIIDKNFKDSIETFTNGNFTNINDTGNHNLMNTEDYYQFKEKSKLYKDILKTNWNVNTKHVYEVKGNIEQNTMQEIAKWQYKMLIATGLVFQVKVIGHNVNILNPNLPVQPWIIGGRVDLSRLVNSKYSIYNDILTKDKLMISGYTVSYDEKYGLITTLDITPEVLLS